MDERFLNEREVSAFLQGRMDEEVYGQLEAERGNGC